MLKYVQTNVSNFFYATRIIRFSSFKTISSEIVNNLDLVMDDPSYSVLPFKIYWTMDLPKSNITTIKPQHIWGSGHYNLMLTGAQLIIDTQSQGNDNTSQIEWGDYLVYNRTHVGVFTPAQFKNLFFEVAC